MRGIGRGRWRRQGARWRGGFSRRDAWRRSVLVPPTVPGARPEHEQDDRTERDKRDEPPPPGFPVSCSRRVPAAAFGRISAKKATPVRTAKRAPATPADLSKGVLSEAAEPRAISGTQGRDDEDVVREEEPPELWPRGAAPKLGVLLEASLDRLSERHSVTSEADVVRADSSTHECRRPETAPSPSC